MFDQVHPPAVAGAAWESGDKYGEPEPNLGETGFRLKKQRVNLSSSLLSYQKKKKKKKQPRNPLSRTPLPWPPLFLCVGGMSGCQGNRVGGSALPLHLRGSQTKAGQGFHGGGPGAQLCAWVWVEAGGSEHSCSWCQPPAAPYLSLAVGAPVWLEC